MPNIRLPFYERPEYFFVSRLERLLEKYPDLPEIRDLLEDARLILDQNDRCLLQSAHAEVMGTDPSGLSPKTREFLRRMFAGALEQLSEDNIEKGP